MKSKQQIIDAIKKVWNDDDLNEYIDELLKEQKEEIQKEVMKIIDKRLNINKSAIKHYDNKEDMLKVSLDLCLKELESLKQILNKLFSKSKGTGGKYE